MRKPSKLRSVVGMRTNGMFKTSEIGPRKNIGYVDEEIDKLKDGELQYYFQILVNLVKLTNRRGCFYCVIVMKDRSPTS